MLRRASAALALVTALAACGDDAGTGGQGGGSSTTTATTATTTGNTGGGGGAPGCDALDCGAGAFCWNGACHTCDAPAGTQHDLVLPAGDGQEDRFYFLHVPSSYTCEPAPLLVDFHGTAGGPRPEEAYQTEALIALAETEGAIVVRPRSRSSMRAGFEVFRWDQNPGDIDRNVAYARNIVEALHQQYNIDPARTYASGFSSGANMASQFLGGEALGLFRGVAPIAGGYWHDPAIAPFDPATALRVYAATGYRDYLFWTARDLVTSLEEASYPGDHLFFRETDTGHDLYDWHFGELFAWLDRGERPAAGDVTAPWVEEVVPTDASFVAATTTASGEVIATTATGQILRRSAPGNWTIETSAPEPVALTGVCADAMSEDVFAVGEGRMMRRLGGVWSPPAILPEVGDPVFGYGYMNGITCAGGALAAVGYWAAMRSDDAGGSWTAWPMPGGPGYQAQAASVAAGPLGTYAAVGYYDYIGRSAGGDLAPVPHQAVAGWWSDVAAAPNGLFLAVGDTGAINRSDDDGASWLSSSVPASTALYAVGFGPDGLSAVAVGRSGVAVFTLDGGLSWDSLPTGLDRFFGAVAFIDSDTVVILGERGAALRADLPP